ncbi:hypothetical protein CORC01_13018 [Colletotrichum orchidophilum]|uniref:DUF6546 domain-containing protein n=1 Tax=Colletotrichum orchidophilum TaxID=1209926 RepID=A0A1G4ARM8_9PEZI|nr:uncharacterized protein CORC01_13018 [Colletotrichum orchidophilum]OHE91672.1 hypothetical protein CORC01_13018 [Colletotrichum orchidophilum]
MYVVLASVSAEWQQFFEKITFWSLNLLSDRKNISQFDNIVQGHRRKLLKVLGFHVLLMEYDCFECDTAESENTAYLNSLIFREALITLFSILRTWDIPTDQPGYNGLSLQLSAMSPSDQDHFFRRPYQGPTEERTKQRRIHRAMYPSAPSFSQYLRYRDRRLGRALELDVDDATTSQPANKLFEGYILPKVPIITKLSNFSFQRDVLRRLSATAITTLMKRLPDTRELHYVFHKPFNHRAEEQRNITFVSLLENIPKSTRVLTLVESPATIRKHYSRGPTCQAICRAACTAIRSLRILHSMFSINPEGFFREAISFPATSPLEGRMDYPDLSVLVLIFKVPDSTSAMRINHLMRMAATVAAYMPRLQVMQVLNISTGQDIFSFLYEVFERETRLSIKASFDVELSRETNVLWERLALEMTRYRLTKYTGTLPSGKETFEKQMKESTALVRSHVMGSWRRSSVEGGD